MKSFFKWKWIRLLKISWSVCDEREKRFQFHQQLSRHSRAKSSREKWSWFAIVFSQTNNSTLKWFWTCRFNSPDKTTLFVLLWVLIYDLVAMHWIFMFAKRPTHRKINRCKISHNFHRALFCHDIEPWVIGFLKYSARSLEKTRIIQ